MELVDSCYLGYLAEGQGDGQCFGPYESNRTSSKDS
jgi:hypothetical protein